MESTVGEAQQHAYGTYCPYGLCNLLPCTQDKVGSHGCNAHDTHKGSEKVMLRLAFINVMFCASAVMRSGPMFTDLLKCVFASQAPIASKTTIDTKQA